MEILKLLSLLFLTFPSTTTATDKTKTPGCQHPLDSTFTPGKTQILSFNSTSNEGVRRTFRLHVPKGFTNAKPARLVLAYHDRGTDAKKFEEETDLVRLMNEGGEDGRKTLVVFPEAIERSDWTSSPRAPLSSKHNDISFTTDLLDHLSRYLCVDTTEIHAIGHGTGGGLTTLLACHPFMSTRIASFALVGAAFYRSEALKEPLFDFCIPQRKKGVPMLNIHGGKDTIIPYAGSEKAGNQLFPVDKWMDARSVGSSCDFDPWADPEMAFNGQIERIVYDCGEGAERERFLERVKVVEGGHGWIRSKDEGSFDTSRYIVDWISGHSLDGAANRRSAAIKKKGKGEKEVVDSAAQNIEVEEPKPSPLPDNHNDEQTPEPSAQDPIPEATPSTDTASDTIDAETKDNGEDKVPTTASATSATTTTTKTTSTSTIKMNVVKLDPEASYTAAAEPVPVSDEDATMATGPEAEIETLARDVGTEEEEVIRDEL